MATKWHQDDRVPSHPRRRPHQASHRTEWIQRMAHIEKRPDRRKPWRVRYRDPLGRERSRSFARKADADRFMATVQADLIRGDWTDPRLSKITVEEWSERWVRTKSHLKPKTLAGYRSNLQAHVIPAFGGYQLRHVDRMAVEEWIADLQASGLGPSGIRQARQVLNSMLTLAVDAGYLPSNPVDGTQHSATSRTGDVVPRRRPSGRPRRHDPGTLRRPRLRARLRRAAMGRSRRPQTQKMRPASALASRSPNPSRTSRANSTSGRPRTIAAASWPSPIPPRPPREHLARHVPDDPEALVFTSPNGAPLRNSNFRRQVWYQAVEEAELPEDLRIHDLRHTCASLFVAAGANPKAVQVHLGHSSITVTMDRYTHLFPSDVDDLVRRLDDIRAQSLAAPPRPRDRSHGIELGGR